MPISLHVNKKREAQPILRNRKISSSTILYSQNFLCNRRKRQFDRTVHCSSKIEGFDTLAIEASGPANGEDGPSTSRCVKSERCVDASLYEYDTHIV